MRDLYKIHLDLKTGRISSAHQSLCNLFNNTSGSGELFDCVDLHFIQTSQIQYSVINLSVWPHEWNFGFLRHSIPSSFKNFNCGWSHYSMVCVADISSPNLTLLDVVVFVTVAVKNIPQIILKNASQFLVVALYIPGTVSVRRFDGSGMCPTRDCRETYAFRRFSPKEQFFLARVVILAQQEFGLTMSQVTS